MTINVNAWKFTNTTAEKPCLNHKDIKSFLNFQYESPFYFGTEELISNGVYKILGWLFNFRPYLKKYVYKQYGHWYEIYAPNKTLLRKVVHGKIDKILEVKENGKK